MVLLLHAGRCYNYNYEAENCLILLPLKVQLLKLIFVHKSYEVKFTPFCSSSDALAHVLFRYAK